MPWSKSASKAGWMIWFPPKYIGARNFSAAALKFLQLISLYCLAVSVGSDVGMEVCRSCRWGATREGESLWPWLDECAQGKCMLSEICKHMLEFARNTPYRIGNMCMIPFEDPFLSKGQVCMHIWGLSSSKTYLSSRVCSSHSMSNAGSKLSPPHSLTRNGHLKALWKDKSIWKLCLCRLWSLGKCFHCSFELMKGFHWSRSEFTQFIDSSAVPQTILDGCSYAPSFLSNDLVGKRHTVKHW